MGVVAASGGNHGAAVAYAAMKRGVPATIFVPSVASPAKMEQIRGYGARLEIAGERYDDALKASERLVAESGALAIHAYDQWETLQGQATVGLEFEEQAPKLDALLVAVGGGGLIGGIAAWYAGRVPLIGVEPEAAPTLTRALAAGDTRRCAGRRRRRGFARAAPGGNAHVPDRAAPRERNVLVTDDAIRESQRALWKTLRIVAEPGGAAALAALLSGRWRRSAARPSACCSAARTRPR